MFAVIALLACQFSAPDRAWIDSARAAWIATSRDGLKLPPAPLPRIVFFDETCASGGVEHRGTVELPDGEKMPVQVTSFTATYGDDAKPYFVMALPPVWRKVPRHAAQANLEQMLRSVFVHEMTHTRQMRGTGKRVGELAAANGLAAEMDDDIIQKRFGGDPAFRAAVENERELFYAAARETDSVKRCALLSEAIASMKARRAKYANPAFAEIEDLFLNMEGAANWAAWYNAKREGDSNATTSIRRDGKWWSQDEGLAIFLVLDALVPDWQQRVFADQPASVLGLLEEAAR